MKRDKREYLKENETCKNGVTIFHSNSSIGNIVNQTLKFT